MATAISMNNRDVVFWAAYLKGNWRKGITNLEYIMQNPETAQEFLDNGRGLQLIYGITDRNSAALIAVIEKYGYADPAITQYFNMSFGWNYVDMADIAASSTAMAAVAASSTAMTAVINTPTALNAVVSSSTAMTAIAASSTARSAVEVSAIAISAINARPQITVEYASGTVNTSGTFRTGYAWVYQAHSGYNSAGNTVVSTTITGLLSGNMAVSATTYSDINRFANNPGWSGPGAYYDSGVANRPAAKLIVW